MAGKTGADGDILVRRLEPGEWAGTYRVVAQLRPHLDESSFLDQVRRQSQSGYELVGAFRSGVLVGVLGMRPVHTLARGFHLHVDDLIVDESLRETGTGRALMAYAEADAKARGMSKVFLDARRQAIPFYERVGYAPHTSPSMSKTVA